MTLVEATDALRDKVRKGDFTCDLGKGDYQLPDRMSASDQIKGHTQGASKFEHQMKNEAEQSK